MQFALACALPPLTFSLMASVFKPAGRKFYMMQISLPDGSRLPYRTTKSTDRREAERKAQEWEVRARKEFNAKNELSARAYLRLVLDAERMAAEGTLTASKTEEIVRRIYAITNPGAGTVTLTSHWNDVSRREAASLGASSIKNLKAAKKRWEKALGKKMDVGLSKLCLDDFEAAMPTMAAGLSAKTVDLYRTMLLKVLNDAVARKIIDLNPASLLKTSSRIKDVKETIPRGVFTPDEIRKLLEAADDEWRGMVLAGFYTSLRLMDVAKLSSDQIEDGFICVTSAKSRTETDTPIHPRLAKWIGNRKGPFFPSQAAETNAAVSTRFSALMKRAGVPKLRTVRTRTFKRSYHSLRHTFATWVANSEIPQDVRMALTGSSDAKVASRYVHTSDERLMDAIATLPHLDEGVA